jgi:ribosomal protein S18 acetylase RimI-like enzyme
MLAIRPATLEDAALVTAQRRAMFFDMGHRDDRTLDSMTDAFLPWVRDKMSVGEYLGWFAVAEDRSAAAGAGLWLMDWPPHMVGPASRRGNILNVYTRPEFRRQGLARRLTEMAVEWCRAHDVRTVILHSSDEGRPLYRALGFESSNEMRLVIAG